VSQNVGFGLKGRPDQSLVVAEMLDRVRMADRGAAFPHMLSGGEQQRVALARALARGPDVILLDEPFSSLDGSLRDGVREDLVTALRDSGTAAIIVTHDAQDAMIMADDLALMDAGRIIQTGSPRELYDCPRSVAAARLLGPLSLVEAQVSRGAASSVLGRRPTALPDGAAWMGVRPSNLTLTEPGAGLGARVASVGFSGAYWVVRADAGPHRLSVHFRGEKPPALGEIIGMKADPAHLIVMPLP
jgi:iron(III) transport system ATP-binding protein